MAVLKQSQRRDFAGPNGSYPIPDKAHAKAAIMLINKGSLTPPQKEHVRSVAEAMLHRGVK